MFALLLTVAITAPPAKDAPAAIANGLAYLDEYGANWMESRKCSSCHHLAQTVWVLSEAKAAGYKIDEKFLSEVSTFLTAADNRAKIFADAADKRPEAQQLSVGAVYALFALSALERPTKEVRELQAKSVKHILERQDKDGGWATNLRPPVIGDKAVSNALIALSLATSKLEGDQAVASKAAWEKSLKQLGEPKQPAELQFPVLKLWLQSKAGDTVGAKATAEKIVSLQNKDGGWGQLKDAPSDAWATGQTLYVLSVAGRKSDDPAIQKGRDWLVKSQLADGSWLMKSRPFGPENKTAKNLEPITYSSTSWALLGLIRSTPKK
jgi:hypothetical protein